MKFSLFAIMAAPERVDATCLVDYVQVPCDAATGSITYSITAKPHEQVDLSLVLEPGPGRHDVVVVFEEDPRLEGSSERAFRDTKFTRTNVIVGADSGVPDAGFLTPKGEHGAGAIEYGMFVSTAPDPRDEYGGWPILTHLETEPGALVPMYLHFDGKENDTYAVIALADGQQVPIVFEGMRRRALFLRTQARTYYRLPIAVRAPAKTGHTELRLLSFIAPYQIYEDIMYDKRVIIESRTPAFMSGRIDLAVH